MVFQSNSDTIGMGWVGGKTLTTVLVLAKGKCDLGCYSNGKYRQLFNFFLKGFELSLLWGQEVGDGLERGYQWAQGAGVRVMFFS